jgi:hypothetical protein
MDKAKIRDLYTDYLLSSFGKTTATGLSRLLDKLVSHDQITRFISTLETGSKELWKEVKSLVRAHETEDGCLIFDDTIIEKAYTDENDIMCWHWDHSKQENVKGINLLNVTYHSGGTVVSVKQNPDSTYEVKINKLKNTKSFIESLRKNKDVKKVEKI